MSKQTKQDTRLSAVIHDGFNSAFMDPAFLRQVANGMEQGVLVWDQNATCVMYTDRVFDVLEMRPQDLDIGMSRSEFLAGAISRNELGEGAVKKTQENFSRKSPFQFDRHLRSGRIVSTAARPMETGGFVVTFTDVTLQRQESADLDDAAEQIRAHRIGPTRARNGQERKRRELEGLLGVRDGRSRGGPPRPRPGRSCSAL